MTEVDVEIIERLRQAASEHGEVADLLQALESSFPFFNDGGSEFSGSDYERHYLGVVISSAAFVRYDSEKSGRKTD